VARIFPNLLAFSNCWFKGLPWQLYGSVRTQLQDLAKIVLALD